MKESDELRARIDALEAELQVQTLVTRTIIAISDTILVSFEEDFVSLFGKIGRNRFPSGSFARQRIEGILEAMTKGEA